MSKGKFELVFAGAALVDRFPRYKRWHSSYESACATASRVSDAMDDYGLARAAHTPMVYGPGCGIHGKVPQ